MKTHTFTGQISNKVLLSAAVCLMAAFAYTMIKDTATRVPAPRVYFDALHDPSLSVSQACASLVGVVARGMEPPAGFNSVTVTLFAIGRPESAYEPIELRPQEVVARSRRAIDGPMIDSKKRSERLRDVMVRCNQTGFTTTSPIYQGIFRVLEHLRMQGDERSLRIAAIQTDGEENVNAVVKAALRGTRSSVALRDVAKLDNTGIDVVFCGFAETRSEVPGHKLGLTPPRHAGTDRHEAVWSALMLDPTRVTFQPFCPKAPIEVTVATE